jgi:hypothetical protein
MCCEFHCLAIVSLASIGWVGSRACLHRATCKPCSYQKLHSSCPDFSATLSSQSVVWGYVSFAPSGQKGHCYYQISKIFTQSLPLLVKQVFFFKIGQKNLLYPEINIIMMIFFNHLFTLKQQLQNVFFSLGFCDLHLLRNFDFWGSAELCVKVILIFGTHCSCHLHSEWGGRWDWYEGRRMWSFPMGGGHSLKCKSYNESKGGVWGMMLCSGSFTFKTATAVYN